MLRAGVTRQVQKPEQSFYRWHKQFGGVQPHSIRFLAAFAVDVKPNIYPCLMTFVIGFHFRYAPNTGAHDPRRPKLNKNGPLSHTQPTAAHALKLTANIREDDEHGRKSCYPHLFKRLFEKCNAMIKKRELKADKAMGS
ncbi:hypothetical protein [Aliiroseovarius sp. F47248L]|uniref:hypothetical protein n=1 Tax=Aliiroseovarius sp. F47248L TaxID=2926420 RepID=UPI001FF27F39|nr:hypothetical protein [Aliiroseovarius sp. F47248L]MCK0139362.1 hypothetical protein [Aliiroseovarius sp. F47248L]